MATSGWRARSKNDLIHLRGEGWRGGGGGGGGAAAAATRSKVLVRVIAFVFEIILENQINLPGHTLLADSHEIIYPVGQTHTEIIYFFWDRGQKPIKNHALSSGTCACGPCGGVPPPPPGSLTCRGSRWVFHWKIAKERVEIADSMHCTTRQFLITEFLNNNYLWLLALKECPNAVSNANQFRCRAAC